MRKTQITSQAFARAKKFAPYENIENGYAKWGEYDDLPQKLIKVAQDAVDKDGLSEGSTWHSACIEGIVKHIVADGLSLENDMDLPKEVNNFSETPNELFERIAADFKILRGFAIEVIWRLDSAAGIASLQIDELYHIPMMNVRAQERDSRGLVQGHYVSKYFGARREKVKDPTKDDRVEFIPRFNPNLVVGNEEEGRKTQVKQILVVTAPSLTGGYYPEPDYKGGLIDVFTDSILRKARISTLNNAVIASSVYQIAGISTEDTESDFMRDFDQQVTGAQNAGTPIILKKPEGDQHIIGAPTSVGDVTETSSDFDNDIRARIFSSHGVTSARILGIKEDNQGFSVEQIMEEFLVFTTLTIRPIQKRMLSGLNKLAPYLIGSENKFQINPIQLAEAIEGEGPVEDIQDSEEDTNDIIPTEDGTNS